MKLKTILALDVGTTSTRSIIFDLEGKPIFQSDRPYPLSFPENGWVEQSTNDILEKTLEVIDDAITHANENKLDLLGMGITNQRETTIVWDKHTGESIYPAIVWQDRRTHAYCKELGQTANIDNIVKKTGLRIDPYFSASKVHWILNHVDDAKSNIDNLLFGTVDTFIIWHLTNRQSFFTDASNASRTLLYNIRENRWSDELLKLFEVPQSMLAGVKNSCDFFGETDEKLIGVCIPILGVAGDQQAAAIGQACLKPGMIKSTYGTGCFVLMNTGDKIIESKNNMLSTIAYRIDNKNTYALEGSIFNAGTIIQWLRDQLKFIEHSSQTEDIAQSVDNNHGVYIVPAFTGLGAPYWDANARGAIYGLTRSTDSSHLIRAALESVCYQTFDLFQAMQDDSDIDIKVLRVDGGMTNNKFLLQLLSDILNIDVERPHTNQTTALGAAYLAGLKLGVYESLDDIQKCWQKDYSCQPSIDQEYRQKLLAGWKDAVQRTLTT